MIVCGLDIGSLSTKAIVMEDGEIVGSSCILTGAHSVESAEKTIALALKESNLSIGKIGYTVATGYGRVNVPFAQKTITEISCHAEGNHWLYPDVRTILDMGGQDCKAIRCNEYGKVIDFAMNDSCAAGTGRYLERAADALGLGLDQIGPLSLKTFDGPLSISSTCVVFAEGDIIKLRRQGKHKNDILAGATDAIVGRIRALLEKVGVEESLCISGGVAKNIGVVKRLEEKLGLTALIADDPQTVGALGAALFAEKFKTSENSKLKTEWR